MLVKNYEVFQTLGNVFLLKTCYTLCSLDCSNRFDDCKSCTLSFAVKDSKHPPHLFDSKCSTTENSVVGISQAVFIDKKKYGFSI